MPVNRENVTWPSEDGTWNIGFFDFWETGGEDRDFEWDVEYDWDKFNWCSTGHATREDADAAWTGPNPGGGRFYAEVSDETRKYDAMARAWLEEEQTRKARSFSRSWTP